MGGMFQGTPPSVQSGVPPQMGPFANQLTQAISNLFGQGVTPLEQGTIQSTFQLGAPGAEMLSQTAGGAFLPGTAAGQGNPFIQNLQGAIEREGNVARQNLGQAAQRSGALASTDYLKQASGLEADLAQRRGETYANLFESERGRQMQAPGIGLGLGQGLLGMAGYPREVSQQPFQYGLSLLGGYPSMQAPGQPSPFASLLSGLSSFLPLFIS